MEAFQSSNTLASCTVPHASRPDADAGVGRTEQDADMDLAQKFPPRAGEITNSGATSNCVELVPRELHFSGMHPGQPARQKLRIVNKLSHVTKVHVYPPTTQHFKVVHMERLGKIAPGISEHIEIEACSTDAAYHYDSITIRAQDAVLVVPLQSYPSLNHTSWPERIDFGRCALGESATRRVSLSCSVPADFDYSIEVLKPCEAFAVAPVGGRVPANGQVTVSITFTPVAFRTEEMVLQVVTSEHNATPQLCTITGSTLPGIVKERLLTRALGKGPYTMAQLEGLVGNSRGAGALGYTGRSDAYAEQLQQTRKQASGGRDCRRDGPIRSHSPKAAPKPADTQLGGVYMPAQLDTHSALAYVLNQEPGRMRTKDVKDAIEAKRAERASEQAQLQALIEEGSTAGTSPYDRPDIPAGVKAALFKHQAAQYAEATKRGNSGSGGPMLGQGVLSSDEIQQASAAREQELEAARVAEEYAAARRLTLSTYDTGASCTSSPDGGFAYSGLQDFTPRFMALENDTWRKRTQVLRKFVSAVRIVMYRLRAEKRLRKFRGITAELGGMHDQTAAEFLEAAMLERSIVARPGEAPAKLMDPAKVVLSQVALQREELFAAREPLAPGCYEDYADLEELPLQEGLEAEVMGYQEEDLLAYVWCEPALVEQPLLEGALEELEQLPPLGLAPDPATLPSMPAACLEQPFATLEIGSRYTTDAVVAALPTSWGLDPAAAIQPQLYTYHDSTSHDKPGSTALRALANAPVLSASYTSTWDTWSAAAVAAAPPLMAEAEATAVDSSSSSSSKQGVAAANKAVAIAAQVEALLPAAPAADGAVQQQQQQQQQQQHHQQQGGAARSRVAYQQQLDQQKQQLHQQGIAQHDARVVAHNKQLAKPGQHGLP